MDIMDAATSDKRQATSDKRQATSDKRQAINNSTFENQQDIGKAIVSDWTINYNKKHVGKISINSLHEESILRLHNC
jgi:hypothetical protein